MELRARVVEGQDAWFDRYLPQNGRSKFYETKNSVMSLWAPCNQKGFDALFEIGKQLHDADMCSKFEIAAFDGTNGEWGRMFWKRSLDNFENNRYEGRFNEMTQEEFEKYSLLDYSTDAMVGKDGIEYEATYAKGKLKQLKVELEKKDTKEEYEVTYNKNGQILKAEYEQQDGEICYDGKT